MATEQDLQPAAWTTLQAGGVAAPTGTFSHGSEVPVSESLTLVYTSGITSRDEDGQVVGEGDIQAQTRQALTKLQAVLASAGCTIGDVLKVTVFVRDIDEFDTIHRVRREFFKPPYPASTMVQIERLVDPRSLIEIEAVAARRTSARAEA